MVQINLPDPTERTGREAWPDFPETPKPSLDVITAEEVSCLAPDVLQRLLDNDQKLKNYSERLRTQIERYRQLKEEQSDGE